MGPPISVRGEVKEVERDADRDRRIDPPHVIEQDERAADDHGNRGQRV